MSTYYIEFDTRDTPNRVKATKVTLSIEYIADMKKKLAINLVDDPLYKKLEAYVLANPSRPETKK